MISRKIANRLNELDCNNRHSAFGVNNHETWLKTLQDFNDQQIAEVMTKPNMTPLKLLNELVNRTNDKSTKAHLLGFDSFQQQQALVNEIKGKLERKEY